MRALATPAKIRKRQQRDRDRGQSKSVKKAVQKAIDTMPPEWWADCKFSVSPPGPTDERPRMNWDVGAKTNALIEAHAESHGVTLDDILYEVGVQWFITRPKLYWAMKSAKINISDN